MKRRGVCKAAVLASFALSGCLVGSDGRPTGESATPPRTSLESPTPTRTPRTDEPTATPTETIPPLTRDLNEFTVINELDRTATVEVEISVQESDESQVFEIELDPGSEVEYDDLSILEHPVTWSVTHDGETYEYRDYNSGILGITITEDGIEFVELVT